MPRTDPFTKKRIERFVQDFREKSGQLPTLNDFEEIGIDKSKVELAIKDKILSEFYVTLTNGVIKKGYKISDE